MTLNNVPSKNNHKCSIIGSMLFKRHCTGFRVIPKNEEKDVCGLKFKNYGAHVDNYKHSYLACSSSIGVRKKEIDIFVERLDKIMSKLY